MNDGMYEEVDGNGVELYEILVSHGHESRVRMSRHVQ